MQIAIELIAMLALPLRRTLHRQTQEFERRRHETEFKARWVPLLPRESAKKTFKRR